MLLTVSEIFCLFHLFPLDDLWQMSLNCCMEDPRYLFMDEILRLPSIFTKNEYIMLLNCWATTGEEIQFQAADPFYQKCLVNNTRSVLMLTPSPRHCWCRWFVQWTNVNSRNIIIWNPYFFLYIFYNVVFS